MNRYNPSYRFALLSALAATVVACGSESSTAQSSRTSEVAECSLAMSANSTALEVQRTVNAVLTGKIDPCGGTVDLTGTSRELLRIDADDRDVILFFRITHGHRPDSNPQQVP